jgi:Arc/MetJ-type ribon-helix-helix transcriptional regulator
MNRPQPELRHLFFPLYMDMRWLLAIACEKEEAIWPAPQNCRTHGRRLWQVSKCFSGLAFRLTIAFQPRRLIIASAADGCKRLLARVPGSMMNRPTAMPKTKVALTLDADLIEQVDELVERRRFRNRSQAIEAALADKLRRLARTRLATESAKLNPGEEKRFAEEGLAHDLAAWPEY